MKIDKCNTTPKLRVLVEYDAYCDGPEVEPCNKLIWLYFTLDEKFFLNNMSLGETIRNCQDGFKAIHAIREYTYWILDDVTDVYDGDIVELIGKHKEGHDVVMKGVVVKDTETTFENGAWIIESIDSSWKEEHDGEPGVLPFNASNAKYRIIGNIDENPEMVKEGSV